ncbi:MAG: gliding motility lipoprotein GldB [Bacteroidia bacterium]
MLAKLVKKQQFLLCAFLAAFFLLPSCNTESLYGVKVDEIPPVTELKRFDRDFFAMKPENIEADLEALKKKYPDFYPFYQVEIMGWKQEDEIKNSLLLLSDTHVLKIQDTINQIFGDFSEEMAILDPAFKRFAYHFPESATPVIILAYTEFLFRTGTDSAMLVLPLEMYLGENYPVYPNFNIPSYMLRRMNKEHLPTAAMAAWLDQTLEIPIEKNRFLDHLVREGKQLYYLQSVLPETADSLLTGWTTDQLGWLKENEFQMWTFYISENYLYSLDGAYYMPLLSDGPFTAAPNIPPGSAPRIGAYSGWQIVKRYMEENPDVTLRELMFNTDSDKILKESQYRP